jgi:hypothetical protein
METVTRSVVVADWLFVPSATVAVMVHEPAARIVTVPDEDPTLQKVAPEAIE